MRNLCVDILGESDWTVFSVMPEHFPGLNQHCTVTLSKTLYPLCLVLLSSEDKFHTQGHSTVSLVRLKPGSLDPKPSTLPLSHCTPSFRVNAFLASRDC